MLYYILLLAQVTSKGYRYLCLDTQFCFILWRTYLANRCHNRDTCGVDQSLIGAHQVSLISKPLYVDTVYCGHKPYPLIQSQVITNYIYWVIWECTPSEGWNVIPESCLSLKPGTTSVDEIVIMTTYVCLYYIHIMIRLWFVWYPLVRKGTINQIQHVNPKEQSKQLIFMCNKVFKKYGFVQGCCFVYRISSLGYSSEYFSLSKYQTIIAKFCRNHFARIIIHGNYFGDCWFHLWGYSALR